ncbi:hypothetical protein MRX96_000257 [Rhipicephalus microplus]
MAGCWWIAVSKAVPAVAQTAVVVAPTASGSRGALFKPVPMLFDDEPSPQEIWSAVASSIAQWQRAHNGRHRRSTNAATAERGVCYGSLGCYRCAFNSYAHKDISLNVLA